METDPVVKDHLLRISCTVESCDFTMAVPVKMDSSRDYLSHLSRIKNEEEEEHLVLAFPVREGTQHIPDKQSSAVR